MRVVSLLSALAVLSGVRAGAPLEPDNGKIYLYVNDCLPIGGKLSSNSV